MQIIISKTTILLAIFFLLGLSVVIAAQSNQPFTLTADSLANGKQIALDKLAWKYHAGDDVNWAKPEFDDSAWETLNGTILTLDDLPQSGWNGIGWFRLRLKIDESLINQQLALIMDHWGASEVYVDGELVNQFGKVGATAETEEAYRPNKLPFVFKFHGERAEHLIVVRHSLTTLRDPSSLWSRFLFSAGASNLFTKNLAGLEIGVTRSATAVQDYEYAQRAEAGNRFWRGGMFLMIGVVFLLLYLFYPSRRVNLYFSLAAIINFINLPIAYVNESCHFDLPVVAMGGILVQMTFVPVHFFLLVFLYAAFADKRIPKYFWVIVAGYAVFILSIIFFATSSFSILLNIAFHLFFIAESGRLMFRAIAEKQDGAWIVGIGIVLFDVVMIQRTIFLSYQLLAASTPFPSWVIFITRQIYLGLVISIAVYLARQFAQTNKTLEAQLVKEVEQERAANQLALEREQEKARFALVEAENERRAKELEEARQLQLSMLPKKLPVISNLEIAAYMKPATEVGGDYYDFYIGADGTLTVAVGDATGHGLKAGTVVTATKSLFANLAHAPNIGDTLKQISAALKSMNLRGLFMAMAMLKIKDNQVSLSIAGMPSALVYRSHSKTVEEINIRAMPLGSLAKTGYGEEQFTLAAGDVVLLMSDGFPEMFNPENEMLGFGKATEVLPDIAMNSPQEIINHLVKVGEEWANGRAQDDDVTFVVLKVKTDAGVDSPN